MSTLSEYKIQKSKVSVSGGQTITVRGLGIDSIVALIRGQGDVMRDLYSRAVEGKLSVENTGDLLELLLEEAPVVAALIIAFGSDEPDNWEICMEMPLVDQLVLFEEIILLTLVTEGGVKKIQEIILRATKSMGNLNTQAA